MALDLTRIVYKKLEDGNYNLKVNSWDVKQTTKSEDYVVLNTTIPALNDRPVQVNLFEKGLNITAVNITEHLQLPELTLVDLLDQLVGKTIPAYHQTVEQEGKTYYNWYICSTPRVTSEEDSF